MANTSKEELKYLEGRLKQNPDSIMFARLADLYLSMNRIDEAIQICEQGIKKYPYYVTGHYIMGKCYLKKKQFDQAEKELKRVILFDPNYIAAHRDYGELMAQIGWLSSCEASYERILEIDPINTKAKERWSEVEKQLKQQESMPPKGEIDFKEFEDAIIIPDEISRSQDAKKPFEEETIEEFEEAFTEKPVADKISPDEEEKFTHILDDIFRDDEIHTDTELENKNKMPSSTTASSKFSFDKNKLSPADSLKPFPLDEEPPQLEDFEGIFSGNNRTAETVESNETIDFESIASLKEKKPEKKKEKIVTPTLGEIYAAQHQYAKAIGVYEILKKNDPDNPVYQQKIEYLKKKLEESQNLEK